ncbi:MAG TPA: xanthomonadin biosynthesis protein [Rhodanobacteraceae bacterium]
MPIVAAHPRHDRAGRVPWLAVAVVACAGVAVAGSLSQRRWLSVAAMVLLLLVWLPRVLRRRSTVALLAWAGLAALLLVPTAFGHIGLALMALPVVCLGAVGGWFASSLARGVEPLVARFIRLAEGAARLELPGVRAYARGVTLFWAGLLGALALVSLVIALFARPGGWFAVFGWTAPVALPGSLLVWYPEIGCWAVLLAAFAGEYVFRRWRLRDVPQVGPARFAWQLLRYWPELLREGAAK